MPRSKSSKPKLAPDDGAIPEGWTRHAGGSMPCEPKAMPALFFRNGSIMQPNSFPAEHWDAFAEGSCWSWRGCKPHMLDILAYRLDEDHE